MWACGPVPRARSARGSSCHHSQSPLPEEVCDSGLSRVRCPPQGETRDPADVRPSPVLLWRFTKPRRIFSPLGTLHSPGSAPRSTPRPWVGPSTPLTESTPAQPRADRVVSAVPPRPGPARPS